MKPQKIAEGARGCGDEEPENQRREIGLRIVGVLEKEASLDLAILFGSTVEGRLRAESDVDVAVLFDQPLSAHQKLRLSEALGQAVAREVDLVDLSVVNGVILSQVLCKGVVLLKLNASSYEALLKRMVYNREDMMPYYHRTIEQRLEKFVHG